LQSKETAVYTVVKHLPSAGHYMIVIENDNFADWVYINYSFKFASLGK